MSQALTDVNYIFAHFVEFVFNDMEFFNGVSFGWVCIACLIFGILVKSILQVPSRIHGNIHVQSYNRVERQNQFYENSQGRRYLRRDIF